MLHKEQVPSFLIRFGLLFVFLYAAISEFIHPETFLHYIPSFISQIVPAHIFLTLFAIYEIFLAVWIISRIKAELSAVFATLTICAITLFNVASFDVVFRNISILFSSLALFYLDREPPREKASSPSQQPTTPLPQPAQPQSTGLPQSI